MARTNKQADRPKVDKKKTNDQAFKGIVERLASDIAEIVEEYGGFGEVEMFIKINNGVVDFYKPSSRPTLLTEKIPLATTA